MSGSVLDVLVLDGSRIERASLDHGAISLTMTIENDRDLWVGRPVQVRIFEEDFRGWIESYDARPRFDFNGQQRPSGPFEVGIWLRRDWSERR